MDKIKLLPTVGQCHTLKDALAKSLESHSSSTFFEYWKASDDERPSVLTYRQVDNIVTYLAHRLETEHKIQGEPVAFLADHSLQYAIYLLALLKLECRLMLLSPRNSEPAIVDLMRKTNTKVLLYTSRFSKMAAKVAEEISGLSTCFAFEVDIDQAKQDNPPAKQLFSTKASSKDQLEDIALIIHSSGTTGFPKPILLSNRYLLMLSDLFAKILLAVPSPKLLSFAPLFHILGSTIFAITLLGGSYIFPTNFPPLANTFIESLRKSETNCLVTTPVILEQLALRLESHTEELELLKKIKLGICGGASMQEWAARFLLEHGMNIKSGYGTTELGVAAFGDQDPNCKEYSPMRFIIPNEFYEMEESETGDGAKHLVIKASSPYLASNVGNRPDGSYATNDLFVAHPSKPGYWYIIGRADDTLIMSNGEKTNPIPMEAAIRNFHEVISQSAVIGHGRAATAAIVQLDTEKAMKTDIYDILNIVEAAVDVANRDAPSHSKIVFPDMVKILPLSETLPSTDKGTVSRKKVEKLYAEDIEKMYDNFFGNENDLQEGKDTESKLPLEPKTISDFLKTTIASLLKLKPEEIASDVNVFDQGLDSLLAVQLRNSIVKNVRNVSNNFVFQNSTIESMTGAICQGTESGGVEESYKETKSLLSKYIKRIDQEMVTAAKAYQKLNQDGEIIVLTGSTGSLGALILQDLLKSKSVRKIYALVRGKNGIERLHKAFEDRSLDISLLKSSKLQSYPLDLADPHLGLTPEAYKTMQAEATMVCHCAWMLDFLQPVSYFEKESINGLFNLLKLAYRNGGNAMRFHFISSVSASMAMKGEVAETPLPDDPSCAAPMGYAQSKFIAEHILRYVADNKNIPAYVYRVGQMSGDTVKGYWNIQEQYPLMVAGGAAYMRKMPMMDSQIDWIPLDYSASSILEIMHKTANDPPSSKDAVFHIVSPNRVTWMDFLQALRDNGLDFENVSPDEWIKELSEDDNNPAFKLVSFYQDVFGSAEMPVWRTTKTEALSSTLKTTPKIDGELIGKYLQYWRSRHFIK
ncbi:hypothetical protein Unana1_04505 [Umbelopsis nana]